MENDSEQRGRTSRYSRVEPHETKDGSTIRELMHPAVHGNARQSLAEAIVAPRAVTRLHLHRNTEEIYHIVSGHGQMTRGSEVFRVEAGDTICIPPGTPHNIENTGSESLVILCCCAPAYSHDDTELLPA